MATQPLTSTSTPVESSFDDDKKGEKVFEGEKKKKKDDKKRKRKSSEGEHETSKRHHKKDDDDSDDDAQPGGGGSKIPSKSKTIEASLQKKREKYEAKKRKKDDDFDRKLEETKQKRYAIRTEKISKLKADKSAKESSTSSSEGEQFKATPVHIPRRKMSAKVKSSSIGKKSMFVVDSSDEEFVIGSGGSKKKSSSEENEEIEETKDVAATQMGTTQSVQPVPFTVDITPELSSSRSVQMPSSKLTGELEFSRNPEKQHAFDDDEKDKKKNPNQHCLITLKE